MSVFGELLTSAVEAFVELTPEQVSSLEQHWTLLEVWNRHLNLTRIGDLAGAIRRHYAESLFLAAKAAPLLLDITSARVADVGSGPGFPGIPFAVLHGHSSVTLVESHKRKAVFLSEAARHLTNVSVRAARFEETSEFWRLVISRAVAWPNISAHAQKHTRSVALLAGPEDLSSILRSPGFCWNAPTSVPAPGRGFVVLGHSL